MTAPDIHQKLTAVFRDVFDLPTLEISDVTTANDIPEWDSIMHINLIVAVEKAFGISFTTRDVKSLANVGDLKRLISERVS
jgi:acyl carrier protein